ncbi:MAG: ABC-F family ATP-binding cassette domain-containing protein [Phycisphaeraceae bacterium]
MSLLLACEDLRKTYGTRTLFEGVSLAIEVGDRVGLIGPNGAGKSTMLKILAGLETGDDAAAGVADRITRRKGLRVGYVPQGDRFDDAATLLQIVADVLVNEFPEPHEREQQAAMALARVGLVELLTPVGTLSGGWRKRVSIARELAREPDLLLMDEPTNHLDLRGIEWLEQLLTSQSFATVVVTHDRYFLERAANRIVELSRAYPQGTFAVAGPYSTFLERRTAFLEAQQKQEQRLASKVRDDIAWLKQGVKARETRSKSRLDDTKRRDEQLKTLKRRNAPVRVANVDFTASGRMSQKLLVATGLGKSLGGSTLFRDLDLVLSPGLCLGVLGENGAGKTTLLRVLAGELEPDAGSIRRADDLQTVVFTQRREQLQLSLPLREALSPASDFVTFRGQQIHVNAWARRFLFRPDQLNVSVGDLSGGEQARILIANLMLKPADVLILDEPTNDLDIDSLEVLEQSLRSFPGAVLLVTHDRFMLDRLCTQLLALDGDGAARSYTDRLQWQRARDEPQKWSTQAGDSGGRGVAATMATPPAARPAKLSYREKQELDRMEETILAAEADAVRLEALVADPAVAADHVRLQQCCSELEAAQAEVTRLYERWALLSDRPR